MQEDVNVVTNDEDPKIEVVEQISDPVVITVAKEEE